MRTFNVLFSVATAVVAISFTLLSAPAFAADATDDPGFCKKFPTFPFCDKPSVVVAVPVAPVATTAAPPASPPPVSTTACPDCDKKAVELIDAYKRGGEQAVKDAMAKAKAQVPLDPELVRQLNLTYVKLKTHRAQVRGLASARKEISEIRGVLARVDIKLENIDNRFAGIDKDLERLTANVAKLAEDVGRTEGKADVAQTTADRAQVTANEAQESANRARHIGEVANAKADAALAQREVHPYARIGYTSGVTDRNTGRGGSGIEIGIGCAWDKDLGIGFALGGSYTEASGDSHAGSMYDQSGIGGELALLIGKNEWSNGWHVRGMTGYKVTLQTPDPNDPKLNMVTHGVKLGGYAGWENLQAYASFEVNNGSPYAGGRVFGLGAQLRY